MARPKVKKNKLRSDGRGMASLVVGKDVNGKQVRKYFYGETAEEAKEKKQEYISTSLAKSSAGDSDVTLRQWAERWLVVYNGYVADHTFSNRKCAVKKITEFKDGDVVLGDVPIREIKPSQMQALMGSLAGMSRAMITIVRRMAINMLDAAVDEGVLTDSPYRRIRSPKAGRYVGHRALPEQEQAIIDRAAPHHRAGLWAMLMMYAGLRREEMAALEWRDIHDGTIHVCRASEMNGKTKETKTEAGERGVPIVPPLQAALDRVDKAKRHGLVCKSSGGAALTETSYRQAWRSFMLVCTRATNGIEPIDHVAGWRIDLDVKKFAKEEREFKRFSCTAHDLRYTYATMLYDAGVDVKTAAYLLGHKDIGVTMRIYTKLSEQKKSMSFDKLHEYFKEKNLTAF